MPDQGNEALGTEAFELRDETAERTYFTMTPCIVDDLCVDVYAPAVYRAMQRLAGKRGRCLAAVDTIARKAKVSHGKVVAAIKELESREFVKFDGWRKFNGKGNPVKSYVLVDLWPRNMEHYERLRIPSQGDARSQGDGTPSQGDGTPSPHDPSSKDSRGSSRNTGENEQPWKIVCGAWARSANLPTHHDSVLRAARASIEQRLEDGFTLSELVRAIERYDKVLGDPGTWLKHKWTLHDFMSRGEGAWIERFLSDEDFRKSARGAETNVNRRKAEITDKLKQRLAKRRVDERGEQGSVGHESQEPHGSLFDEGRTEPGSGGGGS